MTLSRAIEIIDKQDQCLAKMKECRCDIHDTDYCDGCPFDVQVKEVDEAIHVLQRFAKQIKRRCTTR